nr:immunoglobulin heavy chain junction region [Macaca mulatta]MOV50055.1 immunoglobulin heavy chain junction region [Macaca mulatta]
CARRSGISRMITVPITSEYW